MDLIKIKFDYNFITKIDQIKTFMVI